MIVYSVILDCFVSPINPSHHCAQLRNALRKYFMKKFNAQVQNCARGQMGKTTLLCPVGEKSTFAKINNKPFKR